MSKNLPYHHHLPLQTTKSSPVKTNHLWAISSLGTMRRCGLWMLTWIWSRNGGKGKERIPGIGDYGNRIGNSKNWFWYTFVFSISFFLLVPTWFSTFSPLITTFFSSSGIFLSFLAPFMVTSYSSV
jgi:hypothetical protein